MSYRHKKRVFIVIGLILVDVMFAQVVYSMDPRPPFSERVLPKVKAMTDGRSVDVISGNFS